MTKLDDSINFTIEPDLLHLLREGVAYWGPTGPQDATDEVAGVFGCRDARDMTTVLLEVHRKLTRVQTLTMRALMRALLATELAWASAILGDPTDWYNITGRTDEQTLADVRRLQDLLRDEGAPMRYLHPFDK